MRILWRDRRVLGSLIITLVLLLFMALTAEPGRPYGRLERLWVEFTAPLGAVITDFGERTGGTIGYLMRYPTLVEEHRDLQDRLEQMDAIEADRVQLERENRRLRALLELRQRLDVPAMSASVYARSPGDWNREVMLDRGAEHGVEVGDIVVDPGGLVGRVVSTGSRSSRAMLVTSADSGLGVQIASTGDAGVAEGQLLYEDRIRVTMFSPRAKVAIGDLVTTSEYGEVYPAGIPLGRVADVVTEESGLVNEVWLVPSADLRGLVEVLIIPGTTRGTVNWSPIARSFHPDPRAPAEEGGAP